MNAIEMNIEQIISNAFNQSELLTSNTRTTTALKRMAMDNNLSYGDAIFLSSLGASLKSVVNSYSYMDSIILYMDNSSKCFMSDNGITNLSALSDTGWLSLYQAICISALRQGQKNVSYNTRPTYEFYQTSMCVEMDLLPL